jgi:hypothetical protein
MSVQTPVRRAEEVPARRTPDRAEHLQRMVLRTIAAATAARAAAACVDLVWARGLRRGRDVHR